MEKITVPRQLSIPVTDVEGTFDKLSKKGSLFTLTDNPGDINIAVGHVQGIAYYPHPIQEEAYYILSHSGSDGKGLIMCMEAISKRWFNFRCGGAAKEDMDEHPGGIQIIGDYLVVPVEKYRDKGKIVDSKVRLYSLLKMGLGENGGIEAKLANPCLVNRPGRSAGAAAIVSVPPGTAGAVTHILAVYDQAVVDFYTAKSTGALEDAAFVPKATSTIETEGAYNSISLLLGENNKIYLIGLKTTKSKEYADLYEVDASLPEVKPMTLIRRDCRFFATRGAIKGPLGTSFRWGSGIYQLGDGKFGLYATQRNFVDRLLAANTFG